MLVISIDDHHGYFAHSSLWVLYCSTIECSCNLKDLKCCMGEIRSILHAILPFVNTEVNTVLVPLTTILHTTTDTKPPTSSRSTLGQLSQSSHRKTASVTINTESLTLSRSLDLPSSSRLPISPTIQSTGFRLLGPILGSAVGGAVFVVIIAITIIVVTKRRRHQGQAALIPNRSIYFSTTHALHSSQVSVTSSPLLLKV
ncbi:hypothetical protein H2248_003255 [Termitomyces sp. 'cryptogamus']|nr:hypothetical protein H2248_003255 [Termitomyces sp. 'cryptogamus']